MKLQKIPFQIAKYSGYDKDFPASDLTIENHSLNATGWQSERFCLFPQLIEFKLLQGPWIVQKLQILVHHFKIPTRIDISFTSNDKVQKLGFVFLT
jgi:hypothetical protein